MSKKGRFIDIRVDYNVYESGQEGMGMRIHTKFSVDNLKGIPCRATAYFHFSSGEKLRDFNNSYRATDGQVVVSSDFTPNNDYMIYKDFTLFMPYSELHMADGKYNLKFDVQLYVQGGDFFASSQYIHFTYTSDSDTDLSADEQMIVEKFRKLRRK
jgi:hypothetical protein